MEKRKSWSVLAHFRTEGKLFPLFLLISHVENCELCVKRLFLCKKGLFAKWPGS